MVKSVCREQVLGMSPSLPWPCAFPCFSFKIYFFLFMNILSLSSDTPEDGIISHYTWLWATMWLLRIELRTSERAVSILFIYLFLFKYTVAVFRHTRRGHQIPLHMVVSHHVVAGNCTQDLCKSCQCTWGLRHLNRHFGTVHCYGCWAAPGKTKCLRYPE